MSINRWTDNVVYIMEYYSALKKKDNSDTSTTWINLEDIMLSKISQSEKDKYCMIPFIWGTQSSQIHRNKE